MNPRYYSENVLIGAFLTTCRGFKVQNSGVIRNDAQGKAICMKPNEADNQKEVKRKVDRFLTVLKPDGNTVSISVF